MQKITIFDPSITMNFYRLVGKDRRIENFGLYPYSEGPSISVSDSKKDITEMKLDYDVEKCQLELTEVKYEIELEVATVKESNLMATFNTISKTMEIVDEKKILETAVEAKRSGYALTRFFVEAYNNAPNQLCADKLKNQYFQFKASKNEMLANLIIHYDRMEAIDAMGGKMFSLLNSSSFSINGEATKRHKVLGIPKKAIAWVESMESEIQKSDVMAYLQKMVGDDPNEILDIIDYLKNVESMLKLFAKKEPYMMNKKGSCCYLLKGLSRVREIDPELDLRRVLNYCIKQKQIMSYYDVGIGTSGHKYALTWPSEQANLLADYLQTSPTLKFPPNLIKAHNIAMIEANAVVRKEDEDSFEQYGTKISKTHNWENQDYRFVVPTNYREFLRIGKTFLNCLPLCGPAFIHGLCDIVFVYQKDESDPRYALEVDKNGMILQAKQKHDMEIDDEGAFNAVMQYERTMVKKLS